MLETYYTDNLEPYHLERIYQGMLLAFNSVPELYINTPKVKGKMVGDYLITESYGGFSAYRSMPEYIKTNIEEGIKPNITPVFQYTPLSKLYDMVESLESISLPQESRAIMASWLSMYCNNKFGQGLSSTLSTYNLREFFNYLSDNDFMPAIPDSVLETIALHKVFDLDKIQKNIEKINSVATDKKHIYNDGDYAFYKAGNGLVVSFQEFGYYIETQDNTQTFYVFADHSKKNRTLKSLLKDLKTNTNLIDNAVLKLVDEKVVFSDMAFTFSMLSEDMQMARDEAATLKRKPKKP